MSKATFCHDVVEGLGAKPKTLPCKYFYDARGSELFEKICETPEYYITRTEIALLNAHIDEIVELLGPNVRLIEFGSGAGKKIRILLENLPSIAFFILIDISKTILQESVVRLGKAFPQLDVRPVCADFTQEIQLPMDVESHDKGKKVVFFPGSTIGNFTRREA